MQFRSGTVEAIGNTPLIKLRAASDATGCTILGKAEFMNPGGSVKDRPGRQMIIEAEKRGELKPGGLVVEPAWRRMLEAQRVLHRQPLEPDPGAGLGRRPTPPALSCSRMRR